MSCLLPLSRSIIRDSVVGEPAAMDSKNDELQNLRPNSRLHSAIRTASHITHAWLGWDGNLQQRAACNVAQEQRKSCKGQNQAKLLWVD